MRLAISHKTQMLLIFLFCIAGAITTLIFLFIADETDRFTIFMSGLKLCLYIFYSFLFGRKYLRELKKQEIE